MTRADQEDFLDWAYGEIERPRKLEEPEADYVAYGRPIVRARQFCVANRLSDNPWPVVH